MSRAKEAKVFVGTFGRYEVVKQIGQGGSGVVFEARDEDDEVVAIKALRTDLVSRDKRKRFKQEIHFCQRQLPNIVAIRDHGSFESSAERGLFYVMPRYTQSLRDLMNAGIPKDKVLPYFAAIMKGVESAHREGVVHRDLKPENVLHNSSTDEVVIADFGIARFTEELLITAVETQDQARLANFDYHAPEQASRAKASQVTHLADIFALGLILNELFTGHLARGENFERVAVHAPGYSWVDAVVSRMISYRPDHRPQSIEAVRAEFQASAEAARAAATAVALASPAVINDDYYTDDVMRNPPQISGVDYVDGDLILKLDPPPTRRWVKAFQSFQWGNAEGGTSPPAWRVSGDALIVSVREDRAQKVIDQFKRWQPEILLQYAQTLRREIEVEDRRRIEALKQRREQEEKRARVLSSLRF